MKGHVLVDPRMLLSGTRLDYLGVEVLRTLFARQVLFVDVVETQHPLPRRLVPSGAFGNAALDPPKRGISMNSRNASDVSVGGTTCFLLCENQSGIIAWRRSTDAGLKHLAGLKTSPSWNW